MKRTRILTIFSCLAALVCFIIIRAANSYSQTRSASAEKNIAIKNVSTFRFGVAIDPKPLTTDAAYRAIVTNEFNSITVANYMKMRHLEPKQGKYDWSGADVIVNFALAHNKRVHGHTLVWFNALPDWIKNFQGDSAAWDNLLKNYITAVVTHFKGKVSSWDVVNEAFENDGSYRPCVWYDHIGKDYIEHAFRYAHEADSKALLFYNDFFQDIYNVKTTAIINMVNDLKKKGVIVNGLGIQLHTSINADDSKIALAFKRMAGTGLMIHVSELTVGVNSSKTTVFNETDDLTRQQMQQFANIIAMYKRLVPNAQKYGITTWNVGDKDTFYKATANYKELPQMFDTNYKKKDYFYKVIDALKQ